MNPRYRTHAVRELADMCWRGVKSEKIHRGRACEQIRGRGIVLLVLVQGTQLPSRGLSGWPAGSVRACRRSLLPQALTEERFLENGCFR